MKLASGFCIPEPLPVHTGIKGRQVHPLIRFLLRSRVDEKSADLHKAVHLCFVPGWRNGAISGVPLISDSSGHFNWESKFLKSKSRTIASFSRCRFVRVLLVAVVFCLRMTDTIVVFSVWAANTLKLRSWMTHASVVGVWAWFRCDLAFPLWKDWHPLPPPVLISLARAEDRWLTLWEIWGLL